MANVRINSWDICIVQLSRFSVREEVGARKRGKDTNIIINQFAKTEKKIIHVQLLPMCSKMIQLTKLRTLQTI